MDLSDPALRRGATGKLAHALKLARELQAEMDSWWALEPTTLAQELRNDGRTIDFVVNTYPMFPSEDWYHRAADIMQNYRDALNRLLYAISYAHTAPDKMRNLSFPIRDDDSSWQGWRKKHAMLPDWLLHRFHAFQPYVSGRPYLHALAKSNNIEKHEDGFSFAVTFTELEFGPGEFTVEGLWDDDKLREHLQFAAGDSLDIVSERQVIATLMMPTRVLDVGAANVQSSFAFTPMMRFEEEEVPLIPALELIGKEVTWAIAHITGLVESAVHPPDHFDI